MDQTELPGQEVLRNKIQMRNKPGKLAESFLQRRPLRHPQPPQPDTSNNGQIMQERQIN
jgi:hypothetical protein